VSINTNVQVGEAQLLTVPLWFAQYKYKGKMYSIIAEGASGKILEGKAPLGKYDILTVVAVVAAIIVIVVLYCCF
jgi:hypothetical protein